MLDAGLSYGAAGAVRVRVRKRGHRYDISDDGAAVALAGKPPGWLPLAERVVGAAALNVNRRGAVFVPAVEGRDLAALAKRVGEASRELYLALLDLGPLD
jgi:hypothetical protein